MKHFRLKHLLTVSTLIFIVSVTTIFGGCNAAVGSPLSKTDRETLASAVTDLYNEKTLYANGTFNMKQVRTTTSPVGISTNSTAIDCDFSGTAEYDEDLGDFAALDADAFVVVKENKENYGNAYYMRDGYLYNQFYNYFDESPAALKKECKKDDDKDDLRFLGNIREGLSYIRFDVFGLKYGYPYYENDIAALLPALLASEDSEAVKNVLGGYIKGMCELLSITKTEGNAISEITGGKETYTLDIVRTYCDLLDKYADLVRFYYKSSSLTVGDLFESKEFKAIASPLLKNIKAKDAIDILSAFSAYTEGKISVSSSGRVVIKIDSDYFVTFDEPGNYTLEEYFKNIVLETRIKNGYAAIRIKDVKLTAITGDDDSAFTAIFGSDNLSQAESEKLSEIEDVKNEILETIQTAKVCFTVENKRISRITVNVSGKTVTGGSSGESSGGSSNNVSGGSSGGSRGDNYGGNGYDEDYETTSRSGGSYGKTSGSMSYSTTIKITYSFDIYLKNSAPSLIDLDLPAGIVSPDYGY